MSKTTRHIALFIIVFIGLFGILVLSTLAGEPKALLPPDKPMFSIKNLSRLSTQLTFTPVVTIYLPIVYVRISNNLQITTLQILASDEVIEIKNDGPKSQSMNDWKLVSGVGSETYDFPDGIILDVNQTLRVHSGPDALNNSPSDLLWTTDYIWDDAHDVIELRDEQNVVRVSIPYWCTFDDSGNPILCCTPTFCGLF